MLIALRKILSSLIKYPAKLITALFKFIFYKPLIKIYYHLFRFKKNNITFIKLIKEHSAIILILIISIVLLFSNLLGNNRANALETKISHTIISKIIAQDFSGNSNNEEEIIEEGIDLDNIIAKEKDLYTKNNSLKKKLVSNTIQRKSPKILQLNDDKDIMIKPQGITIPQLKTEDNAEREKTIEYVVKNGDTISNIARKFNLKINTILWANNLSSFSIIRPGDELTILPKNGIVYTVKKGDTLNKIANKYDITEKEIKDNNNLGSVLKLGEKLLLVNAQKKYYSRPVKKRPAYTGITAIKNLVKPANKTITKNNTGKMLWPTVGHRITQYFSWRHSGLDIANKIGTPLYAADDGKVVFAGWSRGYGYNVVIDHGGGRKTRYAHSSKLYVKKGDIVKRGETIAAMGSTGWSTGPHIHFEVIINGKRYNPLNYIK